MYLKSLEVIGFKSFARKTKLDFGPGMSCIVGPNGCGKSNVSDAIRWVLGEQSAKALRGKKMEDVIFNGTDTAKPLNMAEVSLTFADAEDRLGVDYNEVSITRRVYRSGEGQYFINKKACRLKDIHRLFMDSGVGRNSYSMMEQGKIDQILSSKPEDRRAVFEEASGITGFKADKREALRKLKQTEANLLRLDDIIREVKRQIISLQRQAGKARRYQQMKEELRGIDIYLTKRRLVTMDRDGEQNAQKLTQLNADLTRLRAEIEETDQATSSVREGINAIEAEIAETMEAALQARTDLDNARRTMSVNKERISELENYANRDSQDAAAAKERLEQLRAELGSMDEGLSTMQAECDTAEAAFQEAQAKVEDTETTLKASRNAISDLRLSANQTDNLLNAQRRELADLNEREKENIVRHERLKSEVAELETTVETLTRRETEMASTSLKLHEVVEEKSFNLQALVEDHRDKGAKSRELDQDVDKLEQASAACRAKLDMIAKQEARNEDFPGGARMLLADEPVPGLAPDAVVGTLADLIHAKRGFETALESVLRPWRDAVVVRDSGTMRLVLTTLAQSGKGSARILSATPSDAPPAVGGSLLYCVDVDPRIKDLGAWLLANIVLVDSLEYAPSEGSSVTIDGTLLHDRTAAEYFDAGDQASNPLHIQHLKQQSQQELADNEQAMEDVRRQLAVLTGETSEVENALQEGRNELQAARQEEASHLGEHKSLQKQLETASARLEKNRAGLANFAEASPAEQRRLSLVGSLEGLLQKLNGFRGDLGNQEQLLQKIEITRGHHAAEASEKRVKFAELKQQLQAMRQRRQPAEERVRELEAVIANRSQGLESYKARTESLTAEIQAAEENLAPLEEAQTQQNQALEAARAKRQKHTDELQVAERGLREKRIQVDTFSQEKSTLDVAAAESGVRRDTLLEHIAEAYDLTEEELGREADPEWPDGEIPSDEVVAKQVSQIKDKMEKMGPVNLVAIEEHRELEDRYAFMLKHQEDLVEAKKNIEDTIRKIDHTTLDMFMDTFNRVNTNFQAMFKRLFGGGTARLELQDEEDVLESGIDIIARPPGKKPVTITLLSGGERTMTAVALLFSLYQVKPSPFCFLDELDAALDDANIDRFVETLKSFLDYSQFIVITHNRRTIEAGDVLYGVTMQEKGISKIVSVKLSEYENAEALAH